MNDNGISSVQRREYECLSCLLLFINVHGFLLYRYVAGRYSKVVQLFQKHSRPILARC